jgi:hypothetical protein
MLNWPREVKLPPRGLQGVTERTVNQVQATLGTVGFSAVEDAGMKRVQHIAIAEQEGNSSTLLCLAEVNTKFLSDFSDPLLNLGVDPGVATRHS